MSFFNSINFSTLNFSITDFEHPNLQAIERYILPIEFSITTAFVLTFIYIALIHSPKAIRKYSKLLIYQVCTTYSFDLLTLVIQPVVLLPYAGAYVNGYWQFGETGNCIIFLLFMLNITVLMHAFFMQLLYRLASLYEHDSRIHKFTKFKCLFKVMIPALFAFMAAITTGFGFDKPQGEIFRQTLISENPFFKELFKRHDFAMGYHPNFSHAAKGVFGFFFVFAMACIPINIGICYAFKRRLHFLKTHLTQNQKLHVMLLRALLAQGIVHCIFIFLPLLFIATPFVFPYKSACIVASYIPFILSHHTILDIAVQIFFIKPYRDFITQTFRPVPIGPISTSAGRESILTRSWHNATNPSFANGIFFCCWVTSYWLVFLAQLSNKYYYLFFLRTIST